MEILKEKFRQKLIDSKVVLAFLDQLKPKFFSSANHGGRSVSRAQSALFFKISGSALGNIIIVSLFCETFSFAITKHQWDCVGT